MLAIVCAALLGQSLQPVSIDGPIFNNPALTSSRPQPIFQNALVSLEWPYPGADRLPDVTTDSRWQVISGVGIVDGGTEWQWKLNDGGFIVGLDPGTGKVINSFIWGVRALDITAASQAPSVVSTVLDKTYGQNASSTYGIGYGRVAGSANHQNWMQGAYGGGANGFFDMDNDRDGTVEGSIGFWTMLAAPAPEATAGLTDGWGIIGTRYDGLNDCGNNTHGTIDVVNSSFQSCATLRREFDAGTRFFEGSNRPARDQFWNGPLVSLPRANARFSDNENAAILDKAWGSYNADQRLTLAQSPTVQGESIDNTLITGNVDVMWTRAPLITTKGLRTAKNHQNIWATDPLDLTTAVDVGTPHVLPGAICGPFSAMKGGTCECHQLCDDDPAAFEGKESLELIDGGTRESRYRTQDFFLMKGIDDGGAGNTYDQATIVFRTNGSASVTSCAFTGIGTDAGRYACSSDIESGNPDAGDQLIDGGGQLSAHARIYVGTDAGQVGCVTVCQGQNTAGPYSAPPWTTTRAQPDTFYQLSPQSGLQDGGSWPTQLDGGGQEIVYVSVFHPNAVSVQPTIGDVAYLWDSHNVATQDHTPLVVVSGYTGDCKLLTGFRSGTGTNTDLLTPNMCETAGNAYAVRGEWTNLGNGHCNLYVRRDDCGIPPALTSNAPAAVAAWRTALHAFTVGCVARTLVNSDTTGTAVCPGSGALPDKVDMCNRLTENVPGDCQFLAARVF